MTDDTVDSSRPSDRHPPPDLPRATVWIAWLFTIGAGCFAVASIPLLGKVVAAELIGAVYLVGSLFFTSAAALVVRGTPPSAGRADWWAAVIQFAGTVWFNLNTALALERGLTTQEENLRVWTPDFLGSICFIVSSALSWWLVCGGPWCVCTRSQAWRVAALNLAGSLLFMAAAIAAYVVPDTGDPLDSSLANSGTLTGALCFLVGAQLLLRPEPAPVPAGGGRPAPAG